MPSITSWMRTNLRRLENRGFHFGQLEKVGVGTPTYPYLSLQKSMPNLT